MKHRYQPAIRLLTHAALWGVCVALISTASAQTSSLQEEGISTLGIFGKPGEQLEIASGDTNHQTVIKNGPNGPTMLLIGGRTDPAMGLFNDIEPQTNISLPGGTWGTGALSNQLAPIFQNAAFAGGTTREVAAFGAFLQQSDNSSCENCEGIVEELGLYGSGVVGHRQGAQINLNIYAPTGNTTGQAYVGIGTKCNLMATDAGGESACLGFNPVSHIGPNVIANSNSGEEIDTWEEANGTQLRYRIGEQIVDLRGSSQVTAHETYGTQASIDDVALSFNNQYNPSETLGFKVGLEFGRFGGGFPVATNGTLIYGQGNQGSRFTVANGIDLHLGTFTGNAYNDGHVVITGNGNVGIGTESPQEPLHVYSAGSGIAAEFQNAAGTCTFRPSASSLITSCSSDVRLKKDIVDANDTLAYFANMRIRDFTIKSTGERKTGVIAQELQTVHPELVHMGTDNSYTVDEPDPWKLVKAIQEQQAELQEQHGEIEALKAKIDRMRNDGTTKP